MLHLVRRSQRQPESAVKGGLAKDLLSRRPDLTVQWPMQTLLADLPVKIYRRHTCETQFDLGLRDSLCRSYSVYTLPLRGSTFS